MIVVPIETKPQQSFSIILNDLLYRVELRTIQDFTYMSAWIDDELLFYNQLCTPNNWVNPYNYVSQNGKFWFRSLDGNYPYYKNFNNTQELLFLLPGEVEQIQ